MRLSVRISLSIGVLVFIVSVSFGIISIMISAKAVEDTARDSLLRQTALGNNLFSTSLYSQLDILQELANRIDVQAMVWEDQVDDLIPVINRTGYTDMAIVGLDGRSRSIQTGTYENLADQEYVKRALAGEQAISYRLSTNNQEITQPEFIYIVPITANGTRVGALLGRKNTSTITEILGTLSQGETGYAFIMDKEGITIAHPDQALVTSQFNPLKEAASDPRSYESLAQSIRIGLESTSGFGEYTYEGKKKVVGYARITGLPWTLFVTIDDKEINAEVNRLRTIIIIFVLVFLAVGLAVAFILARDITNPIKEPVDFCIDFLVINGYKECPW
ncbi:hypothetical protein FACS1894172_21710 [Spirochaetia bacterium]|nr:hypothetical protein FACS1894172_21710 [Spirochaetia bacterium]